MLVFHTFLLSLWAVRGHGVLPFFTPVLAMQHTRKSLVVVVSDLSQAILPRRVLHVQKTRR